MRQISTYILCVVLFSSVIAQTQDTTSASRFSRTGEKIITAVSNSVSWLDIPVYLGYITRTSIKPSNIGDKIMLDPFRFEKDFLNTLNEPFTLSPGSMDKNIIPFTVLAAGWMTSLSLDLFTNTNVSTKTYQKLFVFKKNLIYTYTLTEIVKNLVNRERPDGSDRRSFFSGHTATTFACCGFINRELQDLWNCWDVTKRDYTLRSILKVSSFITTYGWASYVGYSRVKDKKHYVSDVIVGAIVGTLISNILYSEYFAGRSTVLDNFTMSSFDRNIYLSLNLKF